MSTGWEARLDILKRDAEHDILGPLRTHGWQGSIDREVERLAQACDAWTPPSSIASSDVSADPWEVQWPGITTWTSTASQMICRRRN